MFDIGWMEMLVIAVVAIIVIGPKDLPKVMRTIGQWMAQARSIARTFQEHLDEMARQSGIDEVKREVEAATRLDPRRQIERAVDPDGELHQQMKAMTDVGPLTPSDKAASAAPQSPPPAPSAGKGTADTAEADPVPSDVALPEPAERTPERPLTDNDTSYKGPVP